MRRQKYTLTGEMLAMFFAQDGEVKRYAVLNGPPPDAKFIGVDISRNSRTVKLEYEHDSFIDVEPGMSPQEHMLQVTVSEDLSANSFQNMLGQLREQLGK